jgi:ankyrin repeat protein
VQIQIICQGLAVCAPSTSGLLFETEKITVSALQSLTEALLTSAMAQGLPDAVQANGELLDILNWVSRGLKAELLTATDPINRCFEKSLVLLEEWTAGDQCYQLLTDHNLGRCAVQLSTIINFTKIDLLGSEAASLQDLESGAEKKVKTDNEGTAGHEPTNGERLQSSILNLCSPAVLNRLLAKPVDTVSLLNVCNAVKDAINQRVLAVHDPLLLPALDQLVKAIAGLSEYELIGKEWDCRPLANFSNFLRGLAEDEVNQQPVFQTVLTMFDLACKNMISCINGDMFKEAYPDSQALSNLISFVKICDKRLQQRSVIASTTAATTTATSTSNNNSAIDQAELISAGTRLIAGVLVYEARAFSKAHAISGLLAGLAYLWQRNLVLVTPAMKVLVHDLLDQIKQTRARAWQDKSKKVVLPALRDLLQLGVIEDEGVAQAALVRLMPASIGRTGRITLKHITNENKRLGAIDDVVIPLPMALHVAIAKPAKSATPTMTTTSLASGAPTKAIPGLTPIQPAPPVFTKLASKLNSTASVKLSSKPEWQNAKKTAKPIPLESAHNSPSVSIRAKALPSSKPAAKPISKEKPQQTQKQADSPSVKHKTAKVHATPDRQGKVAPHHTHTALSRAILAGQATAVVQQFGKKPTWSEKEIVAVLDTVMGGLDLIDTEIIKALRVFFTAVKDPRQEAGTSVLTNYFNNHPTSFAGLQALLVEQNLVKVKIDLETLGADEALDYLDALTENEWKNKQETAKVSKLLDKRMAAGQSLMIVAANNNRPEIIGRLLQLPIGEKLALTATAEGLTPLICAAEKGHANIVDLLLAHESAEAQATAVNKDQWNALMLASENGRADIVKLLLTHESAEAQANAVDKDQWNALMFAAKYGHADIVELFLAMDSADAQVTAVDRVKWNALILAVDNGYADIVELLLAHESAEVQATAVDEVKWNALMFASENGRADIVKLLLAHDSAEVQATAVNLQNNNALMIAAKNGHADIVELLLAMDSAAAQSTLVNKDFQSNALMIAAEKGYTDIVKLLLAHASAEAQATAVNKDQKNALMFAAGNGRTDIARMLLATESADTQATMVSQYQSNALIYAVRNGHTDIVELLLQLKSASLQLKVVNAKGMNALEIAKSEQFDAIVVLLEKCASS